MYIINNQFQKPLGSTLFNAINKYNSSSPPDWQNACMWLILYFPPHQPDHVPDKKGKATVLLVKSEAYQAMEGDNLLLEQRTQAGDNQKPSVNRFRCS